MIPLLVILLTGLGGGEPQEKKAPKKGWDWLWKAEAEFAYDSNIWLLESDKQERLRDHDRGGPPFSQADDDEVSGRFDDMETVDDFIVTPSLRWDASAPSPFGRRFDLGVGLEIPYYIQNSKRSYLEFGLDVGQAVGSDGHLRLGFQFIPEYFRKNYLADAVDTGVNGDIQSRERIYEEGTYQEWELELEYLHKLIDRNQNQPFGLTGIIQLSYADRDYDSPFDYRDEKAKGIRLGLGFEYGPRVKWGIYYQYVAADSPSDQHVVLINELLYGEVDGIGFIVNNARSVQTLDRTHKEHEIGLSVDVELGQAFEVEVIYEHLRRDFESDNRFDIEHFGREDKRHSIETRLLWKVSKAWHAHLGYLWREQESKLDDPEGGQDGDYDRFVVYGAIAYRW